MIVFLQQTLCKFNNILLEKMIFYDICEGLNIQDPWNKNIWVHKHPSNFNSDFSWKLSIIFYLPKCFMVHWPLEYIVIDHS